MSVFKRKRDILFFDLAPFFSHLLCAFPASFLPSIDFSFPTRDMFI